MTEKFSDLLQFTTQVSRLMVTEIRRRASNKSTGEPSDTSIFFISARCIRKYISLWFIWHQLQFSLTDSSLSFGSHFGEHLLRDLVRSLNIITPALIGWHSCGLCREGMGPSNIGLIVIPKLLLASRRSLSTTVLLGARLNFPQTWVHDSANGHFVLSCTVAR